MGQYVVAADWTVLTLFRTGLRGNSFTFRQKSERRHKSKLWHLRCTLTKMSYEVSKARAADKYEEVSLSTRTWNVKIILKYMANSFIYCEWWYLSCISQHWTQSLDGKLWQERSARTRHEHRLSNIPTKHITVCAFREEKVLVLSPLPATKLHCYNDPRNQNFKGGYKLIRVTVSSCFCREF